MHGGIIVFSEQTSILITSVEYSAFNMDWMHVSGRTSIKFRVRVCSDARITLSEYSGVTSVNSWSIVLGAQENTIR